MAYSPNPIVRHLKRLIIHPGTQVVLALLCLVVLSLTTARVLRQYHPGGPYSAERGGMADYHNGVYFPATAVRNGISPYGKHYAESYPVARPSPAYSPFMATYHIPLTWLAIEQSDVVYFLLLILLLAATIVISLREVHVLEWKYWFLPFFLAVLVSRSGHISLLNGYFTPELVLGAILALSYAEKIPWLSALGLLITSGKPNYVIPIMICMMARGNYRSVFLGAILCLLGGLLPAAWIASHSSWSELIASVREGQELHMADPREFPINSWTRIDLTAIISKWTGGNPSEFTQLLVMIPLLALPCWSLRRLKLRGDRDGATTRSGAIAILGVIVSIYHHSYDALLNIAPVAGLLLSQHASWSRFTSSSRIGLILLLTVPWWNYFSSETFLHLIQGWTFLQKCLTSMNAVAMAIGLTWLSLVTLKSQGTGEETNTNLYSSPSIS